MKELGIALAQVNVTVGALAANAAKIAGKAREAAEAGASVIVFPELAVSGYPPEDLILKKHFLNDCEAQLERLAKDLPEDAVVVVGCPTLDKGKAHNSAIVFAGGQVVARYHKMALPNYGVFDEKRVFVAGEKPLVLDVAGARVGIHICEDSWATDEKACTDLQKAWLDALLNLSASPYHRGKLSLREQTLGKAARAVNAHLLYSNLVGGQDELVFDGASMALGPDGKLVSRAKQFEEDILYVRVPVKPTPPVPSKEGTPLRKSPPPEGLVPPKPEAKADGREAGVGQTAPQLIKVPMVGKKEAVFSNDWKNSTEPALDDLAEVYAALKLGLRDYVEKNGFIRVVVALSGGVDSALVAALAVDALGPERVAGITMPSQHTSAETLADAEAIAAALGIVFHTVPIRKLYDAYARELSPLWRDRAPDVTEENIQARIRGNIVMALSNKFGWLVLTTGNKSELATGYCTLYGDMAGGFAVIKDVPKTLVFELAKWRNASAGRAAGRQGAKPVIPPSVMARPPTAELRPNQKDTDSLPPYDLLDPILERYIERDLGVDEIVAEGFDLALVKRVARMVDRNEYKRRQGVPGVKITPKAFGRDRRMPITNLYGERT